jgi:hypothetical protein
MYVKKVYVYNNVGKCMWGNVCGEMYVCCRAKMYGKNVCIKYVVEKCTYVGEKCTYV